MLRATRKQQPSNKRNHLSATHPDKSTHVIKTPQTCSVQLMLPAAIEKAVSVTVVSCLDRN